eukprot:8788956-Karenia_brevis.AAC.1
MNEADFQSIVMHQHKMQKQHMRSIIYSLGYATGMLLAEQVFVKTGHLLSSPLFAKLAGLTLMPELN